MYGFDLNEKLVGGIHIVEEACNAVLNKITVSLDIGGNDRLCRAERFDYVEGESFLFAGCNVKVCSSYIVSGIGYIAGEVLTEEALCSSP